MKLYLSIVKSLIIIVLITILLLNIKVKFNISYNKTSSGMEHMKSGNEIRMFEEVDVKRETVFKDKDKNKDTKRKYKKPEKPDKTCDKERKERKEVDCPKVYVRGNNYFVYIDPKSKYAKSIGDGEFPYGSNRESAKRIFELNFPDCKVPDLLKYGHRSTHLDKNCPFKVRTGNPCLSYQCASVDFSKDGKIKDNECKRVVNHYCELNKDIDDSCMCWQDKNRNNPTCAKKRREMTHPDDFHCNINAFEITEHPDLKNYVRKDKIPCWNCKMDKNGDPGARKNAERTWERVKEFL